MVNKFATLDVKIAALIEILKEIEVIDDQWDENQVKLFQNLISLKEN